jgi:hypothetical protein
LDFCSSSHIPGENATTTFINICDKSGQNFLIIAGSWVASTVRKEGFNPLKHQQSLAMEAGEDKDGRRQKMM